MIFLGTKKYPAENDFEKFILENNGNFNAYTTSDHTLYHFNGLSPGCLPLALDKLSSFFHQPLLNESSMDRERIAVDQEYKKNIESEGWRLHHAYKVLANSDHPFSLFSTGNLETMKKINSIYLHEWFNKNYGTNLMNVAILGKESIEQLEEYAINYFGKIPMRKSNELPSLGNDLVHHYKPQSISLKNFKPNVHSRLEILTIFFSVTTLVIAFASVLGKKLPRGQFLNFIWFVCTGLIHIITEGWVVWFNKDVITRNDILSDLWKEYALADSRYIISDPFIINMEGITAVS
ncbi:hypothetical protein HK099_000472 [Clydaea vesicula]|uniref:Peptidase M16 C-terminal domain-containing protein n=1 Tax=Clydaea vesicula TaxID=447962 RepID=A0AAD5TVB8_9FUNG|nr:hypothetical protein HK099_000472 [Clydaea vesicula]